MATTGVGHFGVAGHCDPQFAEVREALAANLESGEDLGASVCVMSGDDVVVDLWGGAIDTDHTQPWESTTVCNTYSVTKTMTALAALLLIDSGELDPDAPVTRYWPEFGESPQNPTLVRHILGHCSGIPGWAEPVTLAQVYDQDYAADLLARQEPWFTPGDGLGYQALNFGTLIGELIRRVTGRSLGQFFDQEIAQPLGADYWIGTPDDVIDTPGRIAPMVPPPPSATVFASLPPESIARRTLLNPAFSPKQTITRDFLKAELGAVNGQGNARSTALIQSVMTGGGRVAGKRLLSEKAVRRALQVHSEGMDRVLGVPLRFGLGWALPCAAMPSIPEGEVLWWTGFGGSVVISDIDRGLTIAYVMNKMSPELVGAPKTAAYIEAVYRAL